MHQINCLLNSAVRKILKTKDHNENHHFCHIFQPNWPWKVTKNSSAVSIQHCVLNQLQTLYPIPSFVLPPFNLPSIVVFQKNNQLILSSQLKFSILLYTQNKKISIHFIPLFFWMFMFMYHIIICTRHNTLWNSSSYKVVSFLQFLNLLNFSFPFSFFLLVSSVKFAGWIL